MINKSSFKNSLIIISLVLLFSLSFGAKTQAQSITLELSKGWNMISLGSLEVDFDQFLKDNPQCKIYKKAFWYNGEEYETPSKLEPLKGYWLYAYENCTATLSGSQSSNLSINLHKRWNLISSATSKSFNDLAPQCITYHRWLFSWNPQKNKYDFIEKNQPLDPKRGYWVFLYNNCKLQDEKQDIETLPKTIYKAQEEKLSSTKGIKEKTLFAFQDGELDWELTIEEAPGPLCLGFEPEASLIINGSEVKKIKSLFFEKQQGSLEVKKGDQIKIKVKGKEGWHLLGIIQCKSKVSAKVIFKYLENPQGFAIRGSAQQVTALDSTWAGVSLNERPDSYFLRCTIDWGDGQVEEVKPSPGTHYISHSYSKSILEANYKIKYACKTKKGQWIEESFNIQPPGDRAFELGDKQLKEGVVKVVEIRDENEKYLNYVVKGNPLSIRVRVDIDPRELSKVQGSIIDPYGTRIRDFSFFYDGLGYWHARFITSDLTLEGEYKATVVACTKEKICGGDYQTFKVSSTSPFETPPWTWIEGESFVDGDPYKIKFTLKEGPDDKINNCRLEIFDANYEFGGGGVLRNLTYLAPQPDPHYQIINTKDWAIGPLDSDNQGLLVARYTCYRDDGTTLEAPIYSWLYIRKEYQKDNFLDIVYVPISYMNTLEDKLMFQQDVQGVHQILQEKLPLPKEKIKAHIIEPSSETEKICKNLFPFGEMCHEEVFITAMKSKFGKKVDLIVGLCKNWNCIVRGFGIVGSGLLPGITTVTDVTSRNIATNTFPGYWAVAHEVGHNLGLFHIRAGCRELGVCMGPNERDCYLPEEEKKKLIMDYCYPYEKFGPSARSHIINVLNKITSSP